MSKYYLSLSFTPDTLFPWKPMWRSKIPPRITFFSWTAALGKIFTLENLWYKGVVVVDWCYMCKKSGESVNHLLLHTIIHSVCSFWLTLCEFSAILGIYLWVALKFFPLILLKSLKKKNGIMVSLRKNVTSCHYLWNFIVQSHSIQCLHGVRLAKVWTLVLTKVTRKKKVHNIVDKPFIGTNEYKGIVTYCNNVWQGHW